MYTIENLEHDIGGVVGELAEVRRAKGHDYSGLEDTLDNLREFGWRGVVVRIGDKFKRLKWFSKQNKLAVSDETVEDTMGDLINYALYCLILYRQEKEEIRTPASVYVPGEITYPGCVPPLKPSSAKGADNKGVTNK